MPLKKSGQTTRARLGSVIKSARDIMRKDAGLNSDLDRLPQLSWLLFLRAFDAMEQSRELDDDFRPAIEKPYRWRDWAADPDFTGDDLLTFVDDHLPEDPDRPGLLPYLRGLVGHGDDDPRNVLSAVFQETRNRMLSGYLLRDLINKLHEIDFTSSDDIHTMAFLYESLLKEVRDAAGDSGEFYTPRPVIRFMVEQTFPKLGETILDPACGTGGFLVEAYSELQNKVQTIGQRHRLHADLRGIEKKPLPYLLCMMNLVLHGIESPAVVRDNALVRMSNEIGPASQVDIVLTNPPFGGEEEDSVSKRFPEGTRTKETSWLFLQAVLDKLKTNGRCAIVLPNQVFSPGGVGQRIKEKLLRECNLHTIVRLPPGVFAPYTPIPSNLLFFDKTGPTKEVWFYQISPPDGRKGYSKTKPMRYEEFVECAAWWGGESRQNRVENEHAWRVPIADIIAGDYTLDFANPNRGNDLTHRPPQELLSDLIVIERDILSLFTQISQLPLGAVVDRNDDAIPMRRLGEILTVSDAFEQVVPEKVYETAGIYSYGRGLFRRPPVDGSDTSYAKYNRIRAGQFIYSRLFAWEGALAVVPKDFDGLFVSHEFPTFDIDETIVSVEYMSHLCRWPGLYQQLQDKTTGMGSRRQRVNVDRLLTAVVPVPSLEEQIRITKELDRIVAIQKLVDRQNTLLKAFSTSFSDAAFKGRL